MGETLKMTLGMQMDVGRTSSRTWLPSRAEPRADPPAPSRDKWAQLSPEPSQTESRFPSQYLAEPRAEPRAELRAEPSRALS